MSQITQSKGQFIRQEYTGYAYKIYIPTGYTGKKAIPLLVMLHGCSQDADDFAVGTEMNHYADLHTLMVVYPEQPRSANHGKCWNWFHPEHQDRGRGEPARIVALVNHITQTYRIDAARMYVAGISSGAAMAVILGATYPDLFAAIAVCSGVAYKASTSLPQSLLVMARGASDRRVRGDVAYVAMGVHRRAMPVIVFHGTYDSTVSPKNADQIITQWSQTNRMIWNGTSALDLDDDVWIPEIVTRQATGYGYTEYSYRDPYNRVIMKKYLVDGMRHGWSGGSPSGSFTEPYGPKASAIILAFLLEQSQALPVIESPVSKTRKPVLSDESPALPVADLEQEPGLLPRLERTVRGIFRRIRKGGE